jgi:hypothetical protein
VKKYHPDLGPQGHENVRAGKRAEAVKAARPNESIKARESVKAVEEGDTKTGHMMGQIAVRGGRDDLRGELQRLHSENEQLRSLSGERSVQNLEMMRQITQVPFLQTSLWKLTDR